MQYGSAAGVCRPRDDIRDITLDVFEGFGVLCWVLTHQMGGARGRLGGETRDAGRANVCGCGSASLGTIVCGPLTLG